MVASKFVLFLWRIEFAFVIVSGSKSTCFSGGESKLTV